MERALCSLPSSVHPSPPQILLTTHSSSCYLTPSSHPSVCSNLGPWLPLHILKNKHHTLQQKLGLLLKATNTASCHCPRHLPTACISSALTARAGGGGHGLWGGYGGGDGGGGDGFKAEATGAQAVGAEPDEFPTSTSGDDVIVLDVGGMSCGGCASSVKRILETQPNVTIASVNLATETAIVRITLESDADQAKKLMVKRELGDALAQHLTSCGFKSSMREEVV